MWWLVSLSKLCIVLLSPLPYWTSMGECQCQVSICPPNQSNFLTLFCNLLCLRFQFAFDPVAISDPERRSQMLIKFPCRVKFLDDRDVCFPLCDWSVAPKPCALIGQFQPLSHPSEQGQLSSSLSGNWCQNIDKRSFRWTIPLIK